MLSIQALRERRHSIAMEMRNLVENHTGDKWNAEHQAKYDELLIKIDAADAEITRFERILDETNIEYGRAAARGAAFGVSTDEAQAQIVMEKSIFSSWIRGGREGLNDKQREYIAQRNASIQNDMSKDLASGGYLVPTDFSNQLIEALKAFGGMRKLAQVFGTGNGQSIEWPTTDATSEVGEIVGENTAVTDEDFAFGMKSINAYKFSSKAVAISMELLQDSRIDLEAHVRGRLATRISRITEQLYINGTGVNQPQGALTAAPDGATSEAAAMIGYDDLIDLEHSVDPAYRENGKCTYVMHDQTLMALKKLKDTLGRPLWLPGVATGDPNTINGYGYSINQGMPQIAAGSRSLMFGDFSHYLIRDVMQVMLFRMTDSNFTLKGQVGFLAFYRGDAASIDVGGAWKALKQAAS